MSLLVYYSTKSGNTHRFIENVELDAIRLPLSSKSTILINVPCILITPTYGGGHVKGSVPPPVLAFLRQNKNYVKGVIAGGDRNYGKAFALAGKMIAYNLSIPHLFSFESFGHPVEIEKARAGIVQFWQNQF